MAVVLTYIRSYRISRTTVTDTAMACLGVQVCGRFVGVEEMVFHLCMGFAEMSFPLKLTEHIEDAMYVKTCITDI